MAEQPDSIILEYLRRFDGRQARFGDALRDVSARGSSIESCLASMHGDVARPASTRALRRPDLIDSE